MQPSRSPRRPAALLALATALALPIVAAAVPTAPAGPLATAPSGAVIYTIEEIAFGPLTPELRQALGPVHTIQAAEEVLKVRGVPFAWRRSEALSSALDPKMAQLFKSLPPHEPLIIPRGKGTVVLSVVQQRPAPSNPPPRPPAPKV